MFILHLVLLFDWFGRVSCLKLNVAKCVFVPLAPKIKFPDFAGCIQRAVPARAGFRLQDYAEYLGFQMGPGGVARQWTAAVQKTKSNIDEWAALSAGFFFNVLAANVYILQILCCIGQLASIDASVTQAWDT